MTVGAVYNKLYSYDGSTLPPTKIFYLNDLVYGGVRISSSLALAGGSVPSTSKIRVGIALCVTQYSRYDLVYKDVTNGVYEAVYWTASEIAAAGGSGAALVAFVQNIASSPYYVTGSMYVYDSSGL